MMQHSDTAENKILFICKNKPSLSFSLDLSGKSLIMLEISDLFDMGCKEFNEKSQQYQIDRRSIYNQNYKNFEDKLDREYLNSEFEFNPIIRFIAIQKMFTLTIIDDTKDIKNEFVLSISPMATNQQLFEMIRKKIGIEASTFIEVKSEIKKRFVYKNSKTLVNNQISDNEKFIVYKCDEERKEDTRQGIQECAEQPSKLFVDISNKDAVVKIPFKKEGPDHHRVSRGLNIEGTCKNKNCKLVGEHQYSPQGLGNTEIIGRLYNDIYCVNKGCNSQLEIKNCGFFDCYYIWRGAKSVDEKQVKVKETQYQYAVSDQYTRINPKNKDGSSNQVYWINLWIETVPTHNICLICCDRLKPEEGVFFEKCENQNIHKAHKNCLIDIQTCSMLEGKGDSCISCVR